MIFSDPPSYTIALLSPTSAESRWPSVHRSDWSSPPYDISSIPLRHDSPPVPHLNKVQVALSQQELLIFIRRLLARFPSIKAISSMETSSTSLQLNYVSNKCLRPHTILTECLNKSLKQEMVARVNPFRALYRCDPRLLQESSIHVHSCAANMDCATWGFYLQQRLPLLRLAIVFVLVLVMFLFMPLNLLFLSGGKCGVHVFPHF